MAYMNISISEIIKFIDKNVEYDKNRIKAINIINSNQIEIMVSIGRIFPDIRVLLFYNGYTDGKLHFNIITNGGVKVIMGLLNEFGGKKVNEYLTIEKNLIEFDANKLISERLKDVNVRDISISGEQIYVTIDFK